MQLRRLGRSTLEHELLGALELKLDDEAIAALNQVSEWRK